MTRLPRVPCGWLRFAAAGALALAVLAAGCGEPEGVAEASPAVRLPPLRVADLGGRLRTTDDDRGRVVVLNVWATWCAPCRREMPSLDRLHRTLDPERYVVTAISVDEDPVAVREFLLQRGLTFPNFVAMPRRDFLDALGIRSVPATFVVAPDGTVLRRFSGPREWDDAETLAMLETAWTGSRPGSRPGGPSVAAGTVVPSPGAARAPGGGRDGRS